MSTLQVNTITDAAGTGAPEFTLGLEAATGSAADPSISFLGDVNTGFYQDTTNSVAVAINGVRQYKFDTAGGFLVPTGTAALPSLAFLNDPDTGFLNPTANALGIAVGGSERARFDTNGSMHLGISLGNSSATVGVIISDTARHAAVFRNSNPGLSGGIVQFRFDTTGSASSRFWEGVEGYGSTPDITARVDTDGTFRSDSTYETTGADYAEFFEWDDGNPNNEDRVGQSVIILPNGKIRRALDGEDPDGVVSARPSIIGNSSWNRWHDKFIKDEFGRYKNINGKTKVLNQNFNTSEKYVSRKERKEWAPIGLLGVLIIWKSDVKSARWKKISDVSESLEKWLVR